MVDSQKTLEKETLQAQAPAPAPEILPAPSPAPLPTQAQAPSPFGSSGGVISSLIGSGQAVGMVVGVIMAFLLGLVAAILFWFGDKRWRYIETRSQVAQAIITEVPVGDAMFKSATYEFKVGATPYKRAIMMKDPILANTIEIEYDPSNPNDSARNAEPKKNAMNIIIAGIVVLFISIACLILSQTKFGQVVFAFFLLNQAT